jgi:hypothetical protein
MIPAQRASTSKRLSGVLHNLAKNANTQSRVVVSTPNGARAISTLKLGATTGGRVTAVGGYKKKDALQFGQIQHYATAAGTFRQLMYRKLLC